MVNNNSCLFVVGNCRSSGCGSIAVFVIIVIISIIIIVIF